MRAPHSGHDPLVVLVVILSSMRSGTFTPQGRGHSGRYGMSNPAPLAVSTPAQHGFQVADLLFHIVRLADGVGNLLPQQFTVTAPQAVDGHVDGADADPALGSQFRPRTRALFAAQRFLE